MGRDDDQDPDRSWLLRKEVKKVNCLIEGGEISLGMAHNRPNQLIPYIAGISMSSGFFLPVPIRPDLSRIVLIFFFCVPIRLPYFFYGTIRRWLKKYENFHEFFPSV